MIVRAARDDLGHSDSRSGVINRENNSVFV